MESEDRAALVTTHPHFGRQLQ